MLILNKILPLLVLPPGICLLLITLGLVVRRRMLSWIGVFLLFLLSLPLVSGTLMRIVESPYQRLSAKEIRKADAVVVLSGMIEHTPGAELGEWNGAADRFDGGIDLFRSGKAPLLVFTFGQPPWTTFDVPEGQMLARRARELGVPGKAIRVTDAGGNTSEESVEVAKLLGASAGHRKKIILVTSAFHMRRSTMLFTRAGFMVEPYPVDFLEGPKYGSTVLGYLPTADAMGTSSLALREMIGAAFYQAKFMMENIGLLRSDR